MNNDVNDKIQARNNRYALYMSLLEKIQSKFIDTYASDEDKANALENLTETERREKVTAFIEKEVTDRNAKYEGLSNGELVLKIYNDIEQYSILTEFLADEMVEGFHVNSWEDVRVQYADGSERKISGFCSKSHAQTIMRRLLQNSGISIDDAIPMAEGSINSSIRITTLLTPIVDENTGLASYVRKQRNKVFSVEEYIDKEFATEEVLNLIRIACRRGVSIIVLGKVNTGKTTFVKHVLDSMPNSMEIITIESGAREMNLVKRDEEGNITNNIIHMLTRENKEEEMNITQEKLVVKALRLNPDILSVAEMRDTEAYAAIEASNSGHVVISTAHAGSVKFGHKRIANLSRKRYTTDFHTAMTDACEAFPLGVFIHTTEDGIRRIMNVSECYVNERDEIHYNSLWEFQVEENIEKTNGKVEVVGEYVQVNNPSNYLINQMKMYGITKKELSSLYIGGEVKQ